MFKATYLHCFSVFFLQIWTEVRLYAREYIEAIVDAMACLLSSSQTLKHGRPPMCGPKELRYRISKLSCTEQLRRACKSKLNIPCEVLTEGDFRK